MWWWRWKLSFQSSRSAEAKLSSYRHKAIFLAFFSQSLAIIAAIGPTQCSGYKEEIAWPFAVFEPNGCHFYVYIFKQSGSLKRKSCRLVSLYWCSATLYIIGLVRRAAPIFACVLYCWQRRAEKPLNFHCKRFGLERAINQKWRDFFPDIEICWRYEWKWFSFSR